MEVMWNSFRDGYERDMNWKLNSDMEILRC